MVKAPSRHAVAGIVLGMLSGMLLLPSLMFMNVLIVPVVLISVLGVWSGWAAAAVAMVSQLSMAYLYGGGLMTLAVFDAVVVPAGAILYLVLSRPKFKDGVKWAALVQLGVMFVLVVTAWIAVKQDLIDYMTQSMRAMFNAVPQEQLGLLLSYLGEAGVYGTQTGLDFSKALTAIEQTQLLDALEAAYSAQMRLDLPTTLLVGGMTTGCVGYWLSARVVARRGDQPPIAYLHPDEWRIKPHMVIGPPACTLAVYIAYTMGMRGADGVYLAMLNLSGFFFTIQGLGAVDRRFKRNGTVGAARKLLLIMLVAIAPWALVGIGLASALFGSDGLISNFIRRQKGEGDGQL